MKAPWAGLCLLCWALLGSASLLPNPESNVMPFEPVNYSKPNLSNDYRSSTKLNSRGMGHLYFITKKFMDYILDPEPYPPGFVRVKGGEVVISEDWMGLGLHYWWLGVVVLCALLLGAALPLVGLLFCCCRCAGRCGARSQPYDKRYDTCRRHFYAFLLSVTTVLIMFGVVCAFVTNEYMEEGAQSLPGNVRTSLRDTHLYLNNTKKEVNNLLVTNFGELDTVLNRLLHRSGEIVKDKLGEMCNAGVLANLSTIVSGLGTIRTDLANIDRLTISLKENAMHLEMGLKEVRNMLLERLRQCKSERPCMEFLAQYNITSLSLESNFTQLPDVTSSLHNVSALMASDIESEVLKGKEQFDKIKYTIQKSVDRIIPEISKEIVKSGKVLKSRAEEVTRVLNKVEDLIERNSYRPIEEGEAFLRKYGHYRYYLGLGVSSLLLSVLSCVGFGLLCGYCGKRPDHYSDDCCDKGTASRFLMLGVWLMFVGSSFLVVVVIGQMIVGSVADRALCSALLHPQRSQTFAILDTLVDLNDIYPKDPPLNLSTIITECHKNSSIYRVLGVEVDSVGDDYLAQFRMPERVRQLADSIVLNTDITIITPPAEKQLRDLAASPLNSINLAAYTSVLSDKITSIDLLQMAAALNQTAMKLPPRQNNVKTLLLTEAMYLEVHQERQVKVMGRLANQLHGNASLLQEHLRFNHSSLSHAIDNLLSAVHNAQATLTTHGQVILKKLAEDFGREFGEHIKEYLTRVEREAEGEVGKCWPMSLVYNATVIATCNNILQPYNGFWLSVGWIVLLFVPALLFAIKLSILYQKVEPYPGPLTEADYLYDTYGDRDNIPLANVSGGEKKGKKKKKVRRGGYTSQPVQGAPQQPPRPAQPNEERQWNGPPRYQSPHISSEYERPPPYYFPPPHSDNTAGGN